MNQAYEENNTRKATFYETTTTEGIKLLTWESIARSFVFLFSLLFVFLQVEFFPE